MKIVGKEMPVGLKPLIGYALRICQLVVFGELALMLQLSLIIFFRLQEIKNACDKNMKGVKSEGNVGGGQKGSEKNVGGDKKGMKRF